MIDYFDLRNRNRSLSCAAGEGSKAALSAFDYIIRNAPAEDIAAAA